VCSSDLGGGGAADGEPSRTKTKHLKFKLDIILMAEATPHQVDHQSATHGK
jgi:hypothetical protein